MARKRQPEEPPVGAPEWIVTFSDMVSLLVTFFVMLMSFSTIQEREALVIVGAFGSETGAVETDKGPTAVEPPRRDRLTGVHSRRGLGRPHVRPDSELIENLAEMGQKEGEDYLAVDFAQAPDGLQIGFDVRASFAPGSAEVPPDLRRSLVEIAQMLEHYSHLVVVEGFTDSQATPTTRFPTPEALAAARAAAAARVILDSSSIAPELVQIAGIGAGRPRASNETAGGRTENRRVELRLLALSKSQARTLEHEQAKAR
ncbi:MAG TPA: flagellar motor protein MotB [Planctomycetota bacterium]|nr:flagellar motor protein MotB [Planctomycetota bacterium]